MKISEIEWRRERDLHPHKGYTPVLELLGRKRRLEEARKIADTKRIEIDSDPALATTQLFNIYYDWLTAESTKINL